jgi:hypothetical protein
MAAFLPLWSVYSGWVISWIFFLRNWFSLLSCLISIVNSSTLEASLPLISELLSLPDPSILDIPLGMRLEGGGRRDEARKEGLAAGGCSGLRWMGFGLDFDLLSTAKFIKVID